MARINSKAWWRSLRAWLYRRLPHQFSGWHLKRLAGYERRYGLETEGFTKAGFFGIFQRKILRGLRPGKFIELAVGDGLVGSLGAYLEDLAGWNVESWEHRPIPACSIRQHRPRTQLRIGRLTDWSQQDAVIQPEGITTRGVREAAGVCRAIRQGMIRPKFLGIWNPTQRSLWEWRLRREGYRLEIVYHRMDFYRVRQDS